MKKNIKKPMKASVSAKESAAGQNGRRISLKKVSVTVALTVAILIFGSIALFTTLLVMANTSEFRASRAEYDSYRELASDIESNPDEYGGTYLSALDEEMLQINPDYVCWIRIDGTGIDYPVVRGTDNNKYIYTSFNGEPNLAGTLFMDFRNEGDLLNSYVGEALPHILIYGHNLERGGMFSHLRRFLDERFMEENQIITLVVHGQTVEYRIFSARLTDINDPAYFLNFSEQRAFSRFADRIDAPLHATQILTLSTCTTGGSDSARLVVQGYRLLG